MHNCHERYFELQHLIQRLEKEKKQLEKKKTFNKNLALIFVSTLKRGNQSVNKAILVEIFFICIYFMKEGEESLQVKF